LGLERQDVRFTKLEQTCSACPSQWDARDEHGGYYYIRYRWGRLTVNREGVDGERIVDRRIGDSLDGVLSTSEMLEAIGAETV
jgi:hypothetical protein